MTRSVFESVLAVLIPLAGAMGYVHGTFATKDSVENNSSKIEKVYKLNCKMAIRQNVENAEEICTD